MLFLYASCMSVGGRSIYPEWAVGRSSRSALPVSGCWITKGARRGALLLLDGITTLPPPRQRVSSDGQSGSNPECLKCPVSVNFSESVAWFFLLTQKSIQLCQRALSLPCAKTSTRLDPRATAKGEEAKLPPCDCPAVQPDPLSQPRCHKALSSTIISGRQDFISNDLPLLVLLGPEQGQGSRMLARGTHAEE